MSCNCHTRWRWVWQNILWQRKTIYMTLLYCCCKEKLIFRNVFHTTFLVIPSQSSLLPALLSNIVDTQWENSSFSNVHEKDFLVSVRFSARTEGEFWYHTRAKCSRIMHIDVLFITEHWAKYFGINSLRFCKSP